MDTLVGNDLGLTRLIGEATGSLITAITEANDCVMLEALDGGWTLHAFLAFHEEGLKL